MNYDYPGNVRELKNTLDRMVVLSQDHVITTEGTRSSITLKRMTPVTTYSAHQLVTWKEFKRRSEKKNIWRGPSPDRLEYFRCFPGAFPSTRQIFQQDQRI